MTENIHGHEVFRKMIESSEAYTQDSLRTSIGDWFGQVAWFHTCSTENMFADELIALLAKRRRFFSNETGFRVNEDEICDDA